MNNIDANAVFKAAQKIADKDFMVTVSRYASGDDYPWVVSVGESQWNRVLHVRSVLPDGSDAELDLMKPFSIVGPRQVERTVTLAELIAGSYTGVKRLLQPEESSAA